MPPTVHKVLIHGPSVVQKCVVPIGQFSEEVLKSSHRICKLYKKSFSRKSSRSKTNEDIFKRLLLHSDPLISLTAPIKNVKRKKLPEEVFHLLNGVNELDASEHTLTSSDSSESSDSE